MSAFSHGTYRNLVMVPVDSIQATDRLVFEALDQISFAA